MRHVLVCLLIASVACVSAAEHGLRIDQLPVGSFRDQIESLAPAAKQRAAKRMAKLDLHEHDSACLACDEAGDIYFVCAGKSVARVRGAPAPGVPSGGTKSPLSALPKLHTRPGSANVLLLDCDGCVVTGTAWNNSLRRSSIPAVAYDTDNDPNTYSEAELAAIRQIWQRVAEDYAPFDIDVTTEEPAAITTTTLRVVITRSTDANGKRNPSSTAGGVAYVDVFGIADYARYRPAWVYANNLGSGRADYVAEASSHEAGHNLGLSHDATATTSYYSGHGSGETSWGPIMGTGYDRNVSQWSKGEYVGANQTQNDLAIIAAHLDIGGVGYAPDEQPSGDAVGLPLAFDAGGNASASGIIGRHGNGSADTDAFLFAIGASDVSFTVSPFRSATLTRGGNLDVHLEIRTTAGAVVATVSPAGATIATISAPLPAGTYELRILGAGEGTPTAGSYSTGYSPYGSLGQYTVQGTAAPAAPTANN